MLNGRRPIWDALLKDINLWGHGIGSSATAATKASTEANQSPIISYPHNIHIEILSDWGIMIYSLLLVATLFYLIKYRKPRTAFMIFFAFFSELYNL